MSKQTEIAIPVTLEGFDEIMAQLEKIEEKLDRILEKKEQLIQLEVDGRKLAQIVAETTRFK